MFSLSPLDKMTQRKTNYFLHDISIVALSIVLSFVMVKTHVLSGILASASEIKSLSSLVAGFFFTSIFTTAPAIVALSEIAKNGSVFYTAFFGAIGSLLGDLIIFKFIRDRLSDHMFEVLSHEKWWKRVHHLVFHLKYFRWFTFLMGGMIIASPLPDELGISLLGLAKMKTKHFMPISFIFNFMGILLIALLAKSI
jgi:hypothetical protein